MAHHTMKKSAYENLTDRLNRFPQGAPPSETLYKILKILFSEKEACSCRAASHKTFYRKNCISVLENG